MKGKTITKKTSCCNLDIAVLRNNKGEIYDTSILRTGDAGCKANLTFIHTLIGIIAETLDKEGLEQVITAGKNHLCGGCTSMRNRFPKEHIPICKSCPDAIARAIEEGLKEDK